MVVVNLLCTLLTLTCASGTISGPARVIDGDTIEITQPARLAVAQRRRVRLFGIDAEELDEPNGYAAKAKLILLINGQAVTCSWSGYSYQRVVGVCSTESVGSLNAAMVAAGAALDCAHYSKGLYATLEPTGARAKLKQKGYCR